MTAPTPTPTPTPPQSPASVGRIPPVALAGLVLGLVSGVTLIISGFGYRWGWWGLRPAFQMLRWSAIGGAVGGLVSLVCAVLAWRGTDRGGVRVGLVGLVIGLVVFGVPWSWLRRAKSVPPIHDITTDPTNPPAFVAVLPLRANAPNKAEYAGPDVAAKQLAAYPDVKPILLTVPPPQAFQQALAAARAMGWEIVAADSAAGRIEATATTFWYGFKDDVVIRVTPASGGARVDVRSVSRVGMSDVGTNAQRIRAFRKRLTGA
ncbi:MAG TPA: DUF1499 domain-containing protein, partial [Gemmatimonadales bacterium]|nr:DUF1499 domain-containing protein [Gemmatimonadales bacterium]